VGAQLWYWYGRPESANHLCNRGRAAAQVKDRSLALTEGYLTFMLSTAKSQVL
jgi:hypothetical protein